MASERADLHRSDADEEDDSVKQLKQCSSIYMALQDCLVKNDRDWKSCQNVVRDLKSCNETRKRDEKEK